MAHDQCPSTVKGEKQRPSKAELAATPRALSAVSGAPSGTSWRSLEEFSDDPSFREFVEREFPAGVTELFESSRRGFMKLMGASLALAGLAGCRRPDHKILAYSRDVPEEIVPGKPLYYATSLPRPGGGAEGLLIETHEGRPTKVEGNPLHPINRGKSSVWAQASILDLYDPDRLKHPTYLNPARGRLDATWDDFRAWASEHFRSFDSSEGKGLAFLVDKRSSPSREAAKTALLSAAKWPKARWVVWDSQDSAGVTAFTREVFDRPCREQLSLAKARVIVSIGRDFVNSSCAAETAGLVNAREFASTRRVLKADDPMSRLYVADSSMTLTAAQADHRLRLAPSRLPAFAALLAKAVLSKADGAFGALAAAAAALNPPAGPDLDSAFIEAAAEDLLANRGASLVVAGADMPAGVHALVHAMNAALGNIGTTVRFVPLSDDEGAPCHAALVELSKEIAAGEIDTLVCLDANPLFDAPGELNFGALWGKIKHTITLSVGATETADASTWALNGVHVLEAWGDTRAADGTLAPIQPMIAPLYEPAMSQIELLALLGAPDPLTERVSGYEIVRARWRSLLAGADFDKAWRRALHDGLVTGAPTPTVDTLAPSAALSTLFGTLQFSAAPSETALDLQFVPGLMHDGRFANNAWLQELPATGTRVVWDNPALVSPATAVKLGLMRNPSDPYTAEKFPETRLVTVTLQGRSLVLPVWVMPGLADNTIVLTPGYGRTSAGRVGDGVGFNVQAIRPNGPSTVFSGATIARAAGEHEIASTQNHWSMAGRTSIVRELDLPAWKKHATHVRAFQDPIYNTPNRLNLAEELGELSHTPPNTSLYANPYNRSGGDVNRANPDPSRLTPQGQPRPPAFSERPQWGMSIDLSTCTGCGACTIACQAENNIPVVGKPEVAKGRELTWIRVDRYFTGDDLNAPDEMLHQPVACVHCENAPCETVCPVNATVHGPEGHNYMVYNRCIGTRYCANNCPYKVRRYNFFDYGVTKFNGGYLGQDALESIMPQSGGVTGATGSGAHNSVNPNLVPPRLREKLDEISRMQKNPDVTVRSRGVMEKCSYCIQRTNAAKIECKLTDLPGIEPGMIPDGFVQTACQQACPSEAIVFGDLLDEKSRIHGLRANGRDYALLGFLNTRPRTGYMARVRNPNPKLRRPVEDPFHHHGPGHDETHDSHSPSSTPKGDGPKGDEHAPEKGHGLLDRPQDVARRTALRDGTVRVALRVIG